MSLFDFSIEGVFGGDGDGDGETDDVGSEGEGEDGDLGCIDGEGDSGLLPVEAAAVVVGVGVVGALFCCCLFADDVNFLLAVDFDLFPPNKRPKNPFVIFLLENKKEKKKKKGKRVGARKKEKQNEITASNLYTYNTMYNHCIGS